MILSKAWEAYEYYSGKASEITRQLAFAGIAIIWLFSLENKNGVTLPVSLLIPLSALIFSLSLDLLHYVVASFMWRGFYRRHRIKYGNEENANVSAPNYIQVILMFFYTFKIVAVIFSYILIILHFTSHIQWV